MKAILILSFTLFLIAARAQGVNPPSSSGKIILDNEKVKVTQFETQPGKDVCGSGSHSHAAHLTILLTDANVTVSMPDGKTATHKMPAGTTFWSEAETHTVINSGSSASKVEIIEYKK